MSDTATTAVARNGLQTLVEMLAEARERTLALIAPVQDVDLTVQHDALMSPIVWDLGHIAHFEELWLTRNLDGPIEFGEMPGLYNPFENPRRVRGELALPGVAETLELLASVRERALERIAELDPSSEDPLRHDGYVVRMVAQHEYQHDETILQTLQLKRGEPYRAPRAAQGSEAGTGARLTLDAGAMVRFPGGVVDVGTDDRSAAYDNERPRHLVALGPFRIDVTPVTNRAYLAFVRDGGYARPELWSAEGWAWREREGIVAPREWRSDGEGFSERFFDLERRLDPERPVCHVSWHEADAYARWAGKRLPTEAEWETAASWDAQHGRKLRYPWGDDPPTTAHANVDQLRFDTAPIGTYPRNVSPLGCYGMIGDVWEWTASDFSPYPGYESFPYREYSEVFFGPEYKVLRGGSFATRADVARNTFRNWDYPIRRQIFAGFRCARDG